MTDSQENYNSLYDDPNKYARPASIEINDGVAIVHGYQEFALTKNSLSVLESDPVLQKKYELLKPLMTRHNLQNRTFLDIGANGGFFSFLAAQNDAESVMALDLDDNYINIIQSAARNINISKVQAQKGNIAEWDKPAGIVLALALIHWAYSCTATFGSLELLLRKLADLTEYLLIIEWVDPSDEAINFFHHIDFNANTITSPYNLEAFEEGLRSCFDHYDLIGEVSSTRKIYAAYKTKNIIDLSVPFEFVYPKEELISSRLLTTNPFTDNPIWSCVFKIDNRICKQASFDLASREAFFLNKLDKYDYFPKIIEDGKDFGAYSTVELEFIHGQSVSELKHSLLNNPKNFYHFILECFNLVEILNNEGIIHRDIQDRNIIITDKNKPVLIDFGWAISDEKPFYTPSGLADNKTPSDKSFSNIYQMGLILEKINYNKFLPFSYVINTMINPNPSSRIEDLQILRSLLTESYDSYYKNQGGNSMTEILATGNGNLILLDVLYKCSNELESLVEEKRKLNSEIDKVTEANKGLTNTLVLMKDQLNELNERILDNIDNFQSINSQLAEKDQSIQTLSSQLTDKDQSIQTLSSQLAEKDQSIQTLNTEINSLNIELVNYEMSHSWKITRPFRKIVTRLRRIIK